MEWIIEANSGYEKVAKEILEQLGNPPKVMAMYGQIGAGKTTLVQEICRQLKVEEPVTSPTFALVNQYQGSSSTIYHLDLYRLEQLEEALQMGIEEYLYEKNYCFIEWPELVEDLLPEDSLRISIEADSDNRRKILVLSESLL